MKLRSSLVIACSIVIAGGAGAQSDTRGSFGIEWGTGKIICTDDADSGAAPEEDPSYARAAMWDQLVLGEASQICASVLTPLDGGTWGASAPFSGTDSQGLSADFRLYVLHDRFSWRMGSTQDVEDAGAPAELADMLTTPEFFARFCAAKAAFSLGTASHEGPTPANHRLAGQRAVRVTRQLEAARGDCAPGQIPILYAINLGEHQNRSGCTSNGACAGSTAAQRRLIIVAAEDLALGVNLREALRAGMEEQEVFRDLSLDDYDLFVIDTP